METLSLSALFAFVLSSAGFTQSTLSDLPKIGTRLNGAELRLGGFSGLWCDPSETGSRIRHCRTHTDRGPNLSTDNGDFQKQASSEERPFAVPGFQPRWVDLEIDTQTAKASVVGMIGLHASHGPTQIPLTGIPNLRDADEAPVDERGRALAYDPDGIDPESIARASDGSFWMGEEYGPSLLHFSADGELLTRYVPEGSGRIGRHVDTQALLPNHYALRVKNRGFEAIAIQNARIYAFLQSGLEPAEDSGLCRILVWNPETLTTEAEYLYQLGKGADKISDAIAMPTPGHFRLIEQNGKTGDKAVRRIVEVDLSTATNLVESSGGYPELPETMSDSQRSRAGIYAATGRKVFDLAASGWADASKAEGLAALDANASSMIVVNDNDFGVGDQPQAVSRIGIVRTGL